MTASPCLKIADHCPTLLYFHLNFFRSPTVSNQTWKKKCADFAGLNCFLESADWSTVFSAPDPVAAFFRIGKHSAFLNKALHSARSCRVCPPGPHLKTNHGLTCTRSVSGGIVSFPDQNAFIMTIVCLLRPIDAEMRQAGRSGRRFYQLQMSLLSTGPLLNDSHRWRKSMKAACRIQYSDTIFHRSCIKDA